MLSSLNEIARIIGAYAKGKNDIGAPHFADRRYSAVPFSPSNFRHIAQRGAGRKIAFIDAGNMEIFSSPGLSVHFIRAYFCCFNGDARVMPKKLPPKLEFFCVASAAEKGGAMHFSCMLVPGDGASAGIVSELGGITLSADEPTISRQGGFAASVSVMGSVARRFAEWLYAAKIIENELNEGDILVRDGALISSVKGEADFAKKAYDAAKNTGAVLCACAKTSELLTTTGMPLTAAVKMLAEKNKVPAPWFYHPVAENKNPNHCAEIFICNFHEKTRRAFRFEIERSRAEKMSDEEKGAVFSAMASNSRDAAFLGYPYGLIDADAKSRISFGEAMNLRAMLMSMLSRRGAGDAAELFGQAKDAHEVLNEMTGRI